ncbi:hypothetical protein D3C81_1322790 [compost metagenome]
MAAREDQPQAIVGEQLLITGVLPLALDEHDQVSLRTVETRTAPHRVNGLEPAGRDQPCTWILGDTIALPALDGNEEGIMHGLLCQVEIPQQADQRRQDTPRVPAVNPLDLGAYLHQRCHQSGIRCVTTSTRRSRLSPHPW